MFEDPKNREKIKNIFQNLSEDESELVPMFKRAIKANDPIALYVATKDNSDITWMFDKQEIALMLGGDDALENITSQLLPTEKDKQEGMVFVIFKKIGPLYSIRLEKAVLEEVFL